MDKLPKMIRMPKDIVKAIETYQKDNGISSFTGATLELLRKALKSDGYF